MLSKIGGHEGICRTVPDACRRINPVGCNERLRRLRLRIQRELPVRLTEVSVRELFRSRHLHELLLGVWNRILIRDREAVDGTKVDR